MTRSATQECCIKGNNCVATLAHVRTRLGAGYPAFVEQLPSTARAHAARRILSLEWIPIVEWYPLEEAILATVCAGDLGQYREFTREIVADELNSVYRAFLKLFTVAQVLDKGVRVFGRYFNAGRCEATVVRRHPTPEDPCVAEVELPIDAPLVIEGVVAGVEALLHAAGAGEALVRIDEFDCRPGRSFARFLMSW